MNYDNEMSTIEPFEGSLLNMTFILCNRIS